MKIATLTIDIVAETSKFTAGLTTSQQKARKFARTVKQSLTIVTAFAGALGFAAKRAIDAADQIGKFSRATGVSTDLIQELRFAAEQESIAIQGVDDSVRRFTRRLGLFVENGGGPAANALKALGINVRTAGGELRSTDSLLLESIDKLSKLGDEAKISARASELFGDDFGPKLVPLLAKGRQGIEDYAEKARELGIIIDADIVAKSEGASTKLATLSRVMQTQLTVALASNADAVGNLASAFTKLTIGAVSGINQIGQGLGILFARLRGFSDAEDRIAPIQKRIESLQFILSKDPGAAGIREELERQQELLALVRKDLDGQFGLWSNIEVETAKIVRNVEGIGSGTAAAALPGASPSALRDFFKSDLFPDLSPKVGGVIPAAPQESAFEPLKEAAKSAGDSIQVDLVDRMVGGFKSGTREMLASWIEMGKRMLAQAFIRQLATIIGGAVAGPAGAAAGGFLFGGGRAGGGPVMPGQLYRVNERSSARPEYFVPAVAGRVEPGGAGAVTLNYHIDARGADEASIMAKLPPVLRQSEDRVAGRIRQEMRRGRM